MRLQPCQRRILSLYYAILQLEFMLTHLGCRVGYWLARLQQARLQQATLLWASPAIPALLRYRVTKVFNPVLLYRNPTAQNASI